MRHPPLNSLRAFEAAARNQSMVAAGDELRVTHGAVSKQITALEQDLGVALFERRNRGIHLTQPGKWLAERLHSLFGDLDRTMREFDREGETRGPFTISCEPTLCLRMLIPALSEMKRETGLDVRVLAAGGAVDFQRDHIDIAIRRSDFALRPEIETIMIAPELMAPVMVPDLAAQDVRELPRLFSDTRAEAWPDWQRQCAVTFTGPSVRFEHFYLAIQAAEAGQGMAMASVHMVADALATGRLCAPFGFATDGSAYLAVRKAGVADDRHQAFIAWLTQRMSVAGY